MQKEEAAGSSRSTKRGNRPLGGKQISLVGERRKEGGVARKVAKRVARRKPRRNNGKGATSSCKKDEDAAAASEFFISKGGRKTVEFCGK